MKELSFSEIKRFFTSRPADSNKGSFGRLFCLCGSYGMMGAALLSAEGALRSGVGLAELALPERIYPAAAAALPPAVFSPYPEEQEKSLALLLPKLRKADAFLLGCGLGTSDVSCFLTQRLLSAAKCPVVLDADGINIISGNIDFLKRLSVPVLLTPHPGEMARLCRKSVPDIQKSREQTACAFAQEYGVLLILKGAGTVVALPDGTCFCNPTGNPGMATGGSGDVLAGMIAAFLAQGMSPEKAACAGVYLHGMAGDLAAKKCSQHAMLPSDLIGCLPEVFLKIEEGL